MKSEGSGRIDASPSRRRVPGLPAQVVAKAAEELEEGLVAMAGARRPEGLILEDLDDISPEAAVRFSWCRHHKTIVSLENI